MARTLSNTPKCPKCGDFMWKMGYYDSATGANVKGSERWRCLRCDCQISLAVGAEVIETQIADDLYRKKHQ